MLRCEKESGKLVDSKYISGSRTLLRLHRALGNLLLSFYYYFLFKQKKDFDNEKSSMIAAAV